MVRDLLLIRCTWVPSSRLTEPIWVSPSECQTEPKDRTETIEPKYLGFIFFVITSNRTSGGRNGKSTECREGHEKMEEDGSSDKVTVHYIPTIDLIISSFI